jgi:peptide/nickel transport system ATP-binding protein
MGCAKNRYRIKGKASDRIMNNDIPILECENLCISYFTKAGEIPAVVDFNMRIMAGDSVGIVGESGCGKSTVALAIMNYMGKNGGIVGGSIKFKGRDMTQMSEEELRHLRGSDIAMIYQEPMASLNPAMLIGEQLCEVLITHNHISKDDAYSQARDMLAKVRLPDPDRVMGAYPHQISGGQQQRVVIAMGLLANPSLLLLDEPTTALDVTVEAGIVDLIREIAEEHGTSLLFISHNLGLILETCKRITVMYSGEAVEDGTVKDVFDNMRHPYTRGLFNAIPLPGANRFERPLIPIRGQLPLPHERPVGCNFAPRCDFFKDGLCNQGPIPARDIGRGHMSRCLRIDDIDWQAKPTDDFSAKEVHSKKKVLSVDSLKKHYNISAGMFGGDKRTVKANENINLQALEAETVAIVGESGCGKSTFAKVLMGLENATDGSILLNDNELAYLPVNKRRYDVISQLQMVFQNPFDTLNPSQTVGFQLMRVLEKFKIGNSSAERKERALQLLDEVKLPRDFFDRRPRQLSGGQKQRVGIARAFAGNPAVVIADEPVSALDVSVQAAVTRLLTDIQNDHKTTLLFISHDLSVVRYLSDRVVVMYLGHIVEQGTTDEVFAPPYHPYTEALLSAVPIADTSVKKKHVVLKGEIPSAVNPPPGCPFQTRCQHKIGDICEKEMPPHKEISPGHFIACHLDADVFDKMEPVITLANNKKDDAKKKSVKKTSATKKASAKKTTAKKARAKKG